MRITTMVALAAASAALLAGCSNDDTTDLPSDVNQADVSFTQQMVPHHEQATEMAALAATRSDDEDVLDLASRIEAAQEPEIQTMTGWLKEWGVSPSASDHGSMGHGSGDDMDAMPGMMSDDDMASLADARGADFDRQFLGLMKQHHEGAVAMAKAEQSDGRNADALELAKTIEADQTAEIAEIDALLAR